jgi:flagellar M-ring protein FliF
VLGLGSVMFLFFVTRQLRRREREGFPAEPTWVRELASPRPIAQIGSSPAQPVEVAPLRAPVTVAKKQIEELVERDSDRVAQQVRAWMSED